MLKFGNSEFQHKAPLYYNLDVSNSHKKTLEKAKFEYDKYREAEDKKYISDFDCEMKQLEQKIKRK